MPDVVAILWLTRWTEGIWHRCWSSTSGIKCSKTKLSWDNCGGKWKNIESYLCCEIPPHPLTTLSTVVHPSAQLQHFSRCPASFVRKIAQKNKKEDLHPKQYDLNICVTAYSTLEGKKNFIRSGYGDLLLTELRDIHGRENNIPRQNGVSIGAIGNSFGAQKKFELTNNTIQFWNKRVRVNEGVLYTTSISHVALLYRQNCYTSAQLLCSMFQLVLLLAAKISLLLVQQTNSLKA